MGFEHFVIFLLAVVHLQGGDSANVPGRPLIVLSAPAPTDPYYGPYYDVITNFQLNYAKQVMGKDNIIIIGSKEALEAFRGRKGLEEEHLLEGYLEDVWMRDFTTVGMSAQVLYKYRPNYLSLSDSRFIQNAFTRFLRQCGINSPKAQSRLVLDGGNVVDNDVDAAILTSRIYQDNPNVGRAQLLRTLQRELGFPHIAVIPELEGDTTGHSDGEVSFIDVDTVAMTPLPEPDRTNTIRAMNQTLLFGSETRLVEIDSVYEDETWRGFSSACGLHINLLATENYLYVPTFGTMQAHFPSQSPALDQRVLGQIQQNTKKTVVPITVPHEVCRMGGSVRCLSWQLKGQAADALVQKAKTPNGCQRQWRG